jgi:hypothetical protein
MKIHVEILDDTEQIIAEHTADISQPSSWSAPPGQKFVGKMPQNSGNDNNGSYELFRITFQPHLRVDRPNGWTAPPPSPLTGQTGLPANFPSLGPTRTGLNFPVNSIPQKVPQTQMWSPKAPTPAPQTNSNFNTAGFAPTRG